MTLVICPCTPSPPKSNAGFGLLPMKAFTGAKFHERSILNGGYTKAISSLLLSSANVLEPTLRPRHATSTGQWRLVTGMWQKILVGQLNSVCDISLAPRRIDVNVVDAVNGNSRRKKKKCWFLKVSHTFTNTEPL